MRHRTTLPTILLSFAILACQQQQSDPEEAGEMTSPAVDIAVEEQALDELESRYEEAYAAKDLDAIAAFWLEDGRNIYHDGTEIIGRNAIRAEFERFLAGPGAVSIDIRPASRVIASSGDVAYEVGTYTAAGTGTDGQPLSQTHRYLIALRNVDGEWKIDAVMDTAPLVPGAETPSTTEGVPGEGTPSEGADEPMGTGVEEAPPAE